jgi:hypothetical protein
MVGSRTRGSVAAAGLQAHQGLALRFCYEAEPCGYRIQRQLSARHECTVAAPSLIPKQAGEGVKTDRRDAVSLARLHRAGELTAVWVPDPCYEAKRDLVRARLEAVRALRRGASPAFGFLLRQGCHYGDRHVPSCIADGSRDSRLSPRDKPGPADLGADASRTAM